MAHPHHEHRDHEVSKRRVHSLYGHMPHRASGGSVEHSDAREDKALVKSMVKGAALKADGGKVKARADRACRAKGGRVKKSKGHTSVNVIVAPQGGHPPVPPMVPPAMAPHPPGPPNPAMGAAPPPGTPPMMPHKAGGRVKRAWGGAMPGNGMMPARPGMPVNNMSGMRSPMPMQPGPMMPPTGGGAPMMPPTAGMGTGYAQPFAKGGRVKSGNTWNEGLKDGTQVQHNDSGKTADQKDGQPSRKGMRVVTFWAGGGVKRKTGGAVEHPVHGGMAPKLPSGSGGGEAKLFKAHRAAKNYARPGKTVNGGANG
jgi:hypothetical protein